LHLLGVFKESRSFGAGEKFWRWLKTQDDSHVSTEVYGVAIEIFSQAGHPLQDCEKMYEEALARFPGSFFAYHLSSEAILSDREKPTELKGLPMGLLNAIIQARLLLGDTQKAYLALDTALRLFPTVISRRILGSFLLERPITEAYTVYALAFRAGMSLPGMTFRTLFSSLRLSSNFLLPTAIPVHFHVLRAMLSILYLWVGSGQPVASNTLSELTIAITHIGQLPGVADMTSSQRNELSDQVLEVVKQTWQIFARYGAAPNIAAFNNIIANIAGPAGSRAIVDLALADMKALGLEPNDATRRSVMNVSGAIGDKEMVIKTWEDIVKSREEKGKRPDVIDLNVTIKAARQAKMQAFVQQQADIAKQYLTPKDQAAVDYYFMRQDAGTIGKEVDDSTVDEIFAGVQRLREDLGVFDLKTKDSPSTLDFTARPGTLLREPTIFSTISEANMRKIYDDLSTEQVVKPATKPSEEAGFAEHETSAFSPTNTPVPPTPSSTAQHKSPTGLPLSTLRYESWRAINSLLYHSARHDRDHAHAVDLAIWEEKPVPKRNMGFTEETKEVGEFGFGRVGLSEWLGGKEDETTKDDGGDVELVKREILKLRGRDVE
jgi:hypothetical protein